MLEKAGKRGSNAVLSKTPGYHRDPNPPFSAVSQNLGNFSAKPFPSRLEEGVTGASAPEHGRAEGPHGNVSWNKLETRKRLREQLHSLPVPKGTARELQRDFDKGLE